MADLKEILAAKSMWKFHALLIFAFVICLFIVGRYNDDEVWLFLLLEFAALASIALLIAREKMGTQVRDSQTGQKHQSEVAQLQSYLSAAQDQARQRELLLEKQLKLNQFPLSDHFGPFMEKLKSTDSDQIEGLTHTQFMELYIALEETFKRNNRLPLSRLADIPEDVRRVNQIETLIDLYGKKMQRVRADDSLDEEDRDHKIANWERMMERDISKLEET